MQKIYYATGNPDKFADVAGFIRIHAPSIDIQQCACDFLELQMEDQRAIAIDKARQAWELLKQPVLADDSAIFFEKYNRFPGIVSKQVSCGIGMDGIKRLVSPGDRAYFQLHLVFYTGPEHYTVFAKTCPGSVVFQDAFCAPESLPYDQLFAPDGSSSMTYAELRHKGLIHHFDYRIQAVKDFLDWLQRNPNSTNWSCNRL